MLDRWNIITPTGRITLNPSFHSPTWEPGDVSGPGAHRRDELGFYVRSGDGLRSPGPLVIEGFVWSDAQDEFAIVEELNEIRVAALTGITAVRSNAAGDWVFGNLSGGPEPEILPDGEGGWSVTINLWPARPTPEFRSAALSNLRPRVHVGAEFLGGVLRDIVQRHEPPQLGFTLSPEFLGGALEEPVTRRELDVITTLQPAFHAGTLRDVVVAVEVPQESVEIAAAFESGTLDSIGVKRHLNETVTLGPEFASGSLEET